jgi:type I restriction enzyme, S subunit
MKIEDICTRICSGGTPKSGKAEFYENGTIPWLNTKEINFNRIQATEAFITEEGLNNSSAKWIKPHAVIVAMYGATAGRVAIAEIPLTTNQACCNLEVDETVADYRYVYYWLKQNFDNIAGLANGGAQQNLSAKVIRQIEINLPDLTTQQLIANFLDSFDSKIEANTKINGYLEELGQALLSQYLNQCSECVLLGDLLKLGSGFAFKSSTYLTSGQFKILTIKNVQDGNVDCSSSAKIAELPAKMKNHCRLRVGDVVLSLTGNVGRVGIVAESNCLLNQRVAVLQPDNPSWLSGLYFLFRRRSFQNDLIGIAKGTAQANLSPIETLRLGVPYDESSFSSLCDWLSILFDSILVHKIESRKLAALRDALLPKLMSGEIDVSKIDLTQLNSHLA